MDSTNQVGHFQKVRKANQQNSSLGKHNFKIYEAVGQLTYNVLNHSNSGKNQSVSSELRSFKIFIYNALICRF